MQLSPTTSIKEKMVTDDAGRALRETDYISKSSIDISISEIIYLEEIKKGNNKTFNEAKRSKSYTLSPQETVYVVSKERLDIPPGYVAYVFLKNRYSQKGLISFNTGIVDGGFCGPISTLMTNVSLHDIKLPLDNKYGDAFFRVVFHKIDMTDKEKIKIEKRFYLYEQYCEERARELTSLPIEFMNSDSIKKKVNEELSEKTFNLTTKNLSMLGLVLALLFAFGPLLATTVNDLLDRESQIQKEEIQRLKDRVETLEKKLNSRTPDQ